MKTIRIAAALGLAVLLLAVVWSTPTQSALAQCDPATGMDCSSEKDKKPTATDVPAATATPAPGFTLVPFDENNNGLPTIAATSTPTIDPSVYATARACWDAIYRQTPAPELPTASWGDIQGDSPQCIPTTPPTKVPPISLTHVAGPIFVAPGVKETIIAVLIIGVLLIGLLLIARRLKPPNSNRPPGPPD
jgi:hypothetical protein